VCRATVSEVLGRQEYGMENEDLVGRVAKACQAAIGAALSNPSEALAFAGGLQSALATLNLVASEIAKGASGLPDVVVNAAGLTQSALASVLAHAEAGVDRRLLDAAPMLASLGEGAPSGSRTAEIRDVKPGQGIPLFSQISRDYIEMRRNNGAKSTEIDTLELRRKTFIDVVGDRLVTDYYPRDLQDYISRMRFWPSNVTKRFDQTRGKPSRDDWNTKDVLAANANLHEKPMALKTMSDGYVANIKTMMRYGTTDYNYRDPFASAKIRWPAELRRSAPRESIDIEVLNRLFARGVASGRLDEALIPLVLYLTSRRLGLVLYLRGSDIRRKHGHAVAQTAGVVCDQGVWERVPLKTWDSTTAFVLHELLDAIGFVDWAIARGDDWIFSEPHRHSDPSKYASQLLNRRMIAAGAKGASIETVHSLRGDGIDELREADIQPRAARLQSGHAMGNLHDEYGRHFLSRKEAIAIATRSLPPEIDWSVFEDLDFDALARGRRSGKSIEEI
jgi:integrase